MIRPVRGEREEEEAEKKEKKRRRGGLPVSTATARRRPTVLHTATRGTTCVPRGESGVQYTLGRGKKRTINFLLTCARQAGDYLAANFLPIIDEIESLPEKGDVDSLRAARSAELFPLNHMCRHAWTADAF